MESGTGELLGPGRGVVDHRQFDSFRWRPREPRRYGRSERRPERRFLQLAGGCLDTTSLRGGALEGRYEAFSHAARPAWSEIGHNGPIRAIR